MANFTKCDKCEHYHWDDSKCPGKYIVDHLGIKYIARGFNFKDAADEFSRIINEDNDYINEHIVFTLEDENHVKKSFSVYAEAEVVYNIEEIE